MRGRRLLPALLAAAVVLAVAPAGAQAPRSSPPPPPLPATFFTAETPIRVVPVATGLSHPWSLAFLPGGDVLVTERAGRLRILRGGTLDPQPIAGVPDVRAAVLGGLLEVALHPQFAQNRLLYLTYTKAREDGLTTTALARARLEPGERALAGVREIFVANNWSTSTTNYGGRIAFDRDGLLYLTVGERQEPQRAQDGNDHGGKVLRLRDDGSVPPDNPFAGRAGFQPEIYSLGHRSPQGLAMHPGTGAIWENEHGPLGGDELNIIAPGRNYGWPLVTFGTDYDGTAISAATSRADLEAPFLYWIPSIAVSGLAFYTGDRFPAWKGNVFVGAMFEGRTRGTGHLQRITLNEQGRPIQREPILTELRQRIRDVRQGPDGLLYVLTDEDDGMLLRIEPTFAEAAVGKPAEVAAARADSVAAGVPAVEAATAGAPSLAAPNAAGVAMGHLHYAVRDLEANARFWTALGGTAATAGAARLVKFPDVVVWLTPGLPSGTSDGAVLNHVAFRVRTLAQVEAAGLKVDRLAQFPGVAYTFTPEGERVELFEDAALNLTFTADDGRADPVAARHNRPLATPTAFHHVHLYLPGDAHLEAKAWYARVFGGIPGKRAQYDAVDLPGINLNFSGGRTAGSMAGRTLQHLGLEVAGLEAFCARLAAAGVTLDTPYVRGSDGIGRAMLTDPWGTVIELTEGLRAW
jgi:glucose/arabinose dehydrogenase